MEKAIWELALSTLQMPGLRSPDQEKSQGRTQACHLTPNPRRGTRRGGGVGTLQEKGEGRVGTLLSAL